MSVKAGIEERTCVRATAVMLLVAIAIALASNAAMRAWAELRSRCGKYGRGAPPELAAAVSTAKPTHVHAPFAVLETAAETLGSGELPPNARIGRAESWILLLGCGLIAFLANQPLLESLFVWGAVTDLTFRVEPGASPAIQFPRAGPYDQRLGYVELPTLIQRLTARDFEIQQQARQSPALRSFIEAGGYAIYHEKSQAGLVMNDRTGQPLEVAPYPSAAYQHFSEIPTLLVDTLRFIEDRDLLDPKHPYRNPAIEWRRLALAAAGRLGGVLDPNLRRGGASTLATQIEKYRHSPAGRTDGTTEKVRQMATATARAYLDGPQTIATQKEIVTTYLNSTPLGSRAGYGEVIGIADAMRAWFGNDFDEVNGLLALGTTSGAQSTRRAQVYKEALSLLIAQRRPSYYLNAGRKDLETLANSHLRALAAAGVIDTALRDAALKLPLVFAAQPPAPGVGSFVEHKAEAAVRSELIAALGLPDVYRLERMDLSADVSFDAVAQNRIATILERLKYPRELKSLGLIGDQLLGDANPGQVAWSVVLYERGKDCNRVRIHADSLNQPFDVNTGAKLILGSTAKLRTLATYLGIMDGLYQELSTSSGPTLRQMAATSTDPLRRWAAGYLGAIAPEHRALQPMLDAAMKRRYSASPFEEFFTGGGIHVFHNFERWENDQNPSVERAFEQSMNLSFVRLLRDVIRHFEADSGASNETPGSVEEPVRLRLLQRFADREGSTFVERFYSEYAGMSADESLEHLTSHARPEARRFAVLFRSVRPDDSVAQMGSFLARHLHDVPPEPAAAQMHVRYGPERLSLNDRAYLAGVHPLELWLVAYLQHHPGANRAQVIAASAEERQQAYAWLFKSADTRKQDERIRSLIEEDAFDRLLQDWKGQGYPFGHLVPSLATALGSSGDRPNALATLMGIIVNDGVRQSTTDLERVHFAAGTPYDTEMAYRPEAPKRVMSPEVAATLRRALGGVVSAGTASKVRGVYFGSDGKSIPVGGKTGTGDNRFESFGPGHQRIGTRPVDRTATFVFFLGDRMYGTVTAFVSGPQAGGYHFTSALAVSLLKALAPALQPLLKPAANPSLPLSPLFAQAQSQDGLPDAAEPRL